MTGRPLSLLIRRASVSYTHLFGLALTYALMGMCQSPEQLFGVRLSAGLVSGFVPASLSLVSSTQMCIRDSMASVDMIYNLPDKYSHDLKERIESREGLRQLSRMQELKMGNADYEIINVG